VLRAGEPIEQHPPERTCSYQNGKVVIKASDACRQKLHWTNWCEGKVGEFRLAREGQITSPGTQ